jgi:hypothetical protein
VSKNNGLLPCTADALHCVCSVHLRDHHTGSLAHTHSRMPRYWPQTKAKPPVADAAASAGVAGPSGTQSDEEMIESDLVR